MNPAPTPLRAHNVYPIASPPDVDDAATHTTSTTTVVIPAGAAAATARAMIAEAVASRPVAAVVVVADWATGLRVVEALAAGAAACVATGSSAAVMAEAHRTVARGGAYIGPALGAALLTELRPQRALPDDLAPREIETLTLIASGLTQYQTARRMGLSPGTVNTYTKRIRQKLDVGNKADLTRAAFELGLLGPAQDVPA